MFGRINRKRTLTAIAAFAVLAIAGGAFAYFTTSGEGKGSATVGTSQEVTVTQVGSITNLRPGGEPQAVDFAIHNPQSTKQFISSVKVTISNVEGPNISVATPCTAADFKLTQPTAINKDLAAGATEFSPSGATIAMIDSESNQDGCKEATVNLSFSAS